MDLNTDTRRETRSFGDCELRIEGEGDDRKIAGHAAVFNSLSEDLGGFREKIARGTFNETIANDDVRALWNHSAGRLPLGRSSARTLRMAEDQTGLAIEIDPPETQFARDLAVSIGRRDVREMSFGFLTLKDDWDFETDPPTRTLHKVRLFDVSPVVFPAYPATDIAMRSLETAKGARHDASMSPLAALLGARVSQLMDGGRTSDEIFAHVGRAAGISERAVDEVLTGKLAGLDEEAEIGIAVALGLSNSDVRVANAGTFVSVHAEMNPATFRARAAALDRAPAPGASRNANLLKLVSAETY